MGCQLLLLYTSLLVCSAKLVVGDPTPPGFVDVTLPSGIFRGIATPGIDKFLGIPFAQPPVGNLRFKAPAPIIQTSNAIFNATAFSDACPQPIVSILNLAAPVGEDCLHLNVFRPQGLAANASLPVLFWMHVSMEFVKNVQVAKDAQGGAFAINAASNPQYDPSQIIQRSLDVGKPLIFVSINYRLNTFGFLASATMPPEDLNAGLLDQRLALKFIQTNIASFGGDPTKVTVWGQSAGGGSVQAHFIYPDSARLFRAGIGDSATGPFKTSPDASVFDEPGKPFARLLQATNCAAGLTAISCLQAVPFETLLNISNTLVVGTLNRELWQPAVGPVGSFATERASAKIERGDFLRLPYLGGTNVNEGTMFSTTLLGLDLSGSAETQAFINFMDHTVIDNSTFTGDVINTFVNFFPANDSALGAPFNTGDSLFDRGAAWYTDQMFLSARRAFFQHGSFLQPMFAYYFREFVAGNNIELGVAHQAELQLIFGSPPLPEDEQGLAIQMRDFYINFVTDLNPGSQWMRYNNESPRVMQLLNDSIMMIPDNFDVPQTKFSNTLKVLAEFQK